MNRHYPPLRNRFVDMLSHVVGSPVLTGSVLRSITFFGIHSAALIPIIGTHFEHGQTKSIG